MGAAQSTRKITLVDDEKAGVIKLSESLAHRLRGQLEGQKASQAAAAAAAAQEPVHASPTPAPPPPQAPVLPPPPPSFIEKPLPITPEPPKVPEVIPTPEPPKAPFVPPVPEPAKVPAAPEPATQEPAEPPSSAGLPHVDVTPEPPALPPLSFLAPSPPVVSIVKLPPPPAAPEAEAAAADAATAPPAAAAAAPAPSLPETASAPDVGVAIKAGPGPTLSQPAGSIPPWSIYAEEAHLMVMRLREEKEQEVKKLNQDWRDKMDEREKEFIKMARLSEEQLASALKEVESLFMKASCTPVCQNQQEAVMNCYQDHPRQSLRCSREVEQFTQCVDLSRLQSIMKQEAH